MAAIPLLFTLPKTARVAYPIIVGGTHRGLSSRAIERLVRRTIGPISRGRSILPIMRDEQARIAAGRRVRFAAKGNVINVDKLPMAISQMRGQYSYIVRVKGFDAGGNAITRHVTVSTDSNQLTAGEVEGLAAEAVEEGRETYQMEVTSTLIETARRRLSVV